VTRLVDRFAGAKMCSIGIELPGVPSLVLDNRPGMEAVVEHLVRDHGCRKIAFLAGTPKNQADCEKNHMKWDATAKKCSK